MGGPGLSLASPGSGGGAVSRRYHCYHIITRGYAPHYYDNCQWSLIVFIMSSEDTELGLPVLKLRYYSHLGVF